MRNKFTNREKASSGALNLSIRAPGGGSWTRVVSVHLKLGAAPVASDLFTITKDSGAGSEFDVELFSQDMNGETQAIFYGGDDVLLQSVVNTGKYDGDALTLAFSNAGGTSWAVEVIFDTAE